MTVSLEAEARLTAALRALPGVDSVEFPKRADVQSVERQRAVACRQAREGG
ncbi:MAG: hypothetical protein ABW073_05210 [Acidimicrobiia bacterium]